MNSVSEAYSGKGDKSPGKIQRWVVLLHGLLRTSSSMSLIEKELLRNGYRVINFNYPSRSQSIITIANQLNMAIKEKIPETVQSINFVTHSMGTIIVRYYLAKYQVSKLGRFVMIAPPNKGSEWARVLDRMPLFKWFLGVAGQEVKQISDSLPSLMSPPPCEFGVIAGGLGKSFGLNPLIKGDSDGTVTVSETKLDGMKDFILVTGQHSTLLLQKRVIDNVVSFLGTGKFLY